MTLMHKLPLKRPNTSVFYKLSTGPSLSHRLFLVNTGPILDSVLLFHTWNTRGRQRRLTFNRNLFFKGFIYFSWCIFKGRRRLQLFNLDSFEEKDDG